MLGARPRFGPFRRSRRAVDQLHGEAVATTEDIERLRSGLVVYEHEGNGCCRGRAQRQRRVDPNRSIEAGDRAGRDDMTLTDMDAAPIVLVAPDAEDLNDQVDAAIIKIAALKIRKLRCRVALLNNFFTTFFFKAFACLLGFVVLRFFCW